MFSHFQYGGAVQETQLYGTVIRLNEPVGVIGIVCPNNNVDNSVKVKATPLLSFVSLFAPAICRGNSVIIVPDEEYPLPALDMYQIFDTSDLPGLNFNFKSTGFLLLFHQQNFCKESR